MSKQKYIGIFFHKFGQFYRKIGKTIFTLNANNQFKYRGITFTRTFEDPIYEYKNKIFYYFDYGSGTQIFIGFPHKKLRLQAEFMHDICEKHVINDLIKASKDQLKWWQILIYVSVGIMFIVGYIAGKMGWF